MIRIQSQEKSKRETKRTNQYKNLWKLQNNPKKCLRCLSFINFCHFWSLNYGCQFEQAKENYQKIISETNRFLQSTKNK